MMRSPYSAAAFVLFLLAGSAFADFSMKSLTVFVNANLDGSANVDEGLYIMMNGTQSRELYEITRSAYSDILTWRNRTNLSEFRHHMTRARADISEIRVKPQAVERCNSFMGICYATVSMSYKVNPADQNGSGLFRTERYKPRTTSYTLIPEALSFEQTKITGDLILPAGTNITFSIPQSAEKIHFSTLPANLVDEPEAAFRYDQAENTMYYVGAKRIFTWTGDTLPKFTFTYEIEETLEAEVMGFFRSSQGTVISFITGPQGLAALLIIAAGAASIYYINRLGK